MFALGCDLPETGGSNSTDTHQDDTQAGHDHDSHDGHDHAAHDQSPKHGGHLIELGRNHEYHAELVDDHKTGSITIYMMDSHMEQLSLNAASITLVLTAGDQTEAFELLASQSGGSSEFSSDDAKMMEMIEGEDVKGKLRVNIVGKPFSGTFDHHKHGHEGEGDSHTGHNH